MEVMDDSDQSSYPVMLTVALYSSMWCTLYFVLCLYNYKRSYEWNVRLLTAFHASLVTGLGLWCAFVQGPWPFTDAGGRSTPLQQQTTCICLGYFLFDLSWCLYHQTEGPAMLLHHVLSIMGLSVCALLRWYGAELIGCIVGSEASNPLLQLRWFLKETDNYDTVLGEIVDIAFMLTFGGLRIVVGTYFLYTYYMQDTDFIGRFGGTALYALSWVFWINIVTFAYNKYTKKFQWRQRKEIVLNISVDDKKDKCDDTCSSSKDDNQNIRKRHVKNGFVTTTGFQKKIAGVSENLTEDVLEFSVTRTDVITS